MKRRQFIVAAAATTLAAPAVQAAGNPKLLKFIPQADIALLDPTFAPALVTRNHAYMVYDMLYGVDDAVRPRPQMAAGHVVEDDGKTWKLTLRDGLVFHDGQKVLARDPKFAPAHYKLSELYATTGRFAEAVAEVRQVVPKPTAVTEDAKGYLQLMLTLEGSDRSAAVAVASVLDLDEPPGAI